MYLNILTIPEELRQEIVSELDYYDAWSLKQTCKLFHRVVEIPTVSSFLSHPHGLSLSMLEEWDIIPVGHEACYYCCRLLPAHNFSRFQRWLTSARQKSTNYDYRSWNAKAHFCIECGIKHERYERGKFIFIGYGDEGSKEEAVVPCTFCGDIVDPKYLCCPFCTLCGKCFSISQSAMEAKTPVAFFYEGICDHRAILETCKARHRVRVGECEALVEKKGEPEGEPHWKEYVEKSPREMLAMVGERFIEGKEEEGGWVSGFEYLNSVE